MTDYKLVPAEPTPEMIRAGKHTIKGAETTFESILAEVAYKSMLAAAPAVQGEPVAWRNIKEEKPEDGQDCITKMKHGIIQGTYCSEDDTFSGYYWREMGWYATHWVPAEEAIYTAPQPAVQGEPVGYVSPRLLDALRSGKACGITLEDKPDAHSGVTIPLYTAPQPTEQQPELAKYQPCGCVICTCEHETQCQGCGGHHCGAHPVGQIPNPAYQQVDRQALAKIHASRAADDLHARNRLLVEALEQIERWDGFPSTGEVWEDSGEPVSYGAAFGSNGERDFMREVARAALAAHRKQGGGA